MKVQKYKCWPSYETPTEENTFTYTTSSPEAAAEFLAEDLGAESWIGGTALVDVQAEDGTVYGVTVEIERQPSFHANHGQKRN